MAQMGPRTLAVDWSGRKHYASRHIWLAEARDGRLTSLESGRDREEIIGHLIRLGTDDEQIVVGLDFAFSMPTWFLRHHAVETARDFWPIVSSLGEGWLARCEWPFWGRPGKTRHHDYEPLRRTELAQGAGRGGNAFSTFQIGGAGAVGTGSIRGMPWLLKLAAAGWSIWPFTGAEFPMAIEIYPRLLTGAVRKSCQACRRLYLQERFPDLGREMLARAASTEDAFDAAVSALVMAEHRSCFGELVRSADQTDIAEGMIWRAPNDVWRATEKCGIHG